MIYVDKYIFFIIFDYLSNYDNTILKCLNKSFYKNINEYQRYKINKLICNKYFPKYIRNIIETISNSEILENININDSIYCFSNNKPNIINIYNFSLNKYSQNYNFYKIDSLYSNKGYFNFIEDQIIYLGYQLFLIMFNEIKVYNFINKQWNTYQINYYDRVNIIKFSKKSCVHQNKIFITQSYFENETYTSFPLFILSFDNDNNKYNLKIFSKKKMNIPRKYYEMISYDNKLWIVGGIYNSEYLDTIETYDFNLDEWTIEPFKLNNKRTNFKLYNINNILYVVGGNPYFYNNFSIEKFDNNKKEWIIVTDKNIRLNYTISLLNNIIYIFLKNTYYSYNLDTNIWYDEEILDIGLEKSIFVTINI